jgi:hypothetical protein
MTMQYDVKSAQLNETGQLVSARCRLKQVTFAGTGGQSGMLAIFDTVSTPTVAVYSRSGTTITVSSTGHGLTTGTVIGIAFATASSVSATSGNYAVTVTDANTFTITDPNSGTVTGGTNCYYVDGTQQGKWLTQFTTLTSATNIQQILIPGEGLLANNGIYAQMTNIGFCTIFYG